MARAAAKSRGGKRTKGKALDSERQGPVLVAAGSEIVGMALIGISLLAALALATYAPEDPVGRLVPVSNSAGPVGASLAGWMLRGLGAGAVVLVASGAFLGGRLVMSLGLPPLFSRFWIGALLLIPTVALLPPLLFDLAPGSIPYFEPGWLGTRAAEGLTLFLGTGGAAGFTGLFLLIGALALTGSKASA